MTLKGRSGSFKRFWGGFFFAFVLTAPFLAGFVFCEENISYPLIVSMERRVADPVFRQYQEDVEAGRRLAFNRRRKESDSALAEALAIYAYRLRPEDEFFVMAARCSIPYSSIASINGINSKAFVPAGTVVLLPSIPGLFIHDPPVSDFDSLLLSARAGEGELITLLVNGVKKTLRFIPGADFSPSERALFLNPSLFTFPLKTYSITSRYGIRVSPINGKTMMHKGLDLAAPLGAPVYAVRAGAVVFSGENAIYGNYVIIAHDDGWTSLYGHLSKIRAIQGDKVAAGNVIGEVGSTGLSTGPHLHFELSQDGKSKDPAFLLKK
ncbi:MAG: M23 family metallopeptidase [Spirochaetaceae bacterium]|nr:M23 family metallopeptidase [Spirochaetaceae bacterium]